MPDHEFVEFLDVVFDNMYEFMKEGASFYVWHADSNGLYFRQSLERTGLKIRQNLIWVKNQFTIGRQDYQWKHEPCLYGWKDGASHYFIDLRSLSTVQEFDDETDAKTLAERYKQWVEEVSTVWHENKPIRDDLHPTMKPLSLIKKQVRNSSRQDEIVLDLFGGSGTTLMACEELQRKCRMMEYDPKYADRIIQRWEQYTGEKAVQLDA